MEQKNQFLRGLALGLGFTAAFVIGQVSAQAPKIAEAAVVTEVSQDMQQVVSTLQTLTSTIDRIRSEGVSVKLRNDSGSELRVKVKNDSWPLEVKVKD